MRLTSPPEHHLTLDFYQPGRKNLWWYMYRDDQASSEIDRLVIKEGSFRGYRRWQLQEKGLASLRRCLLTLNVRASKILCKLR
jgi:hypothetical protein